MSESSARSRKNRQALVAELAIVFAVIVLTYALSETRILQALELATYDYRLIFRPKQDTSPKIVYMSIDDASLLKFGRWPWPRSHFGKIVSTLRRFGAKMVFLDIEFPEPSPKVLKESISGKSFLHSLDVFKEGAVTTVGNAQAELTRKFDQKNATDSLEGLKGFVDLRMTALKSELEQAIVNPDQVFATALQRCENVYSVFFVQEPFARILVEAQTRLKKIEAILKERGETTFDQLPDDLKRSADSKGLFDRARLGLYLSKHIDAPVALTCRDLRLETDWVSGEIETARQGVLEEAVVKAVRESPRATFEDVSNWVVKSLGIANPGNYEEFLQKFYMKANSQQIVKERFSLPLFASSATLDLPSSDDFQPPIPLFVDHFRGLGFSNVKPDVDGSIRSVPLFWRLGNRLVRNAALNVVCDLLGIAAKDIEILPGPRVRLHTAKGNIEIPVNEQGQMLINWAGGFADAFERRSLDGVRDYLNINDDLRFHLKQGDLSGAFNFYQTHMEKLETLEAEVWDLERLISDPLAASAEPTRAATAAAALKQAQAALAEAVARQDELEEKMLARSMPLKQLAAAIEKAKAKQPPDLARIAAMQAKLDSSDRELSEARRYREARKERQEQLTRMVKDRICMVGSVASGTVDLGEMPYQEVYPKVGVHANVINTILQGQFLRRMDRLPAFLLLVGLALVSGLLFPRVSILSGSILLVELMGAYLVIAYVVLNRYGLWIDVALPLNAIFLNYTFISVYRYLTEQRQRRFVEKVFAHYLSKEVINQLIEDPDKVKLGGEEVMITPFFSDVAGFSTISEKLTPTELVNLLNEYLTEMTNILLKYQGTLDKFEGDAIIAFFGAPLRFEDHAVKACWASLEMQSAMIRMREQWKKEGKPMMKMRIGLNSGRAVVGNMGSQERFNYTMMGDTVNLASRLEGANKPYGTHIMLSQWTYAGAKDQIEVRELDRILVVGKLEPVTVYELLARKGQLDKAKSDIVELYNKGLGLYRQRDWMQACDYFMKADQLPGGDAPSREYIRRCQEYAAFPPPDGWDGTYQMKDKGK